jgi:hypothetical protein
MESQPGSSRDYALRQIALISIARGKSYEEDEVAEKVGYWGVGHMRQELELWGLPTWFVEGDSPPKPEPQEPKPQEEPESSNRQTRKSGPIEELPPARDAMHLFREALYVLMLGNEDLRYRKESRQGKHYPYRIVSRRTVPDDEWDVITERLGLDGVARRSMYFAGAELKYGTSPRAPLSPLPELIGAYLLAGGDVGKLVEALHPEDSEPNWPEITRYIEGRKGGARQQDGIKSMALRLAILICGGKLEKGKPPPEVSGHHLNLSHRIAVGLEAGVPRKQLYEELLTKLNLSEEEFPWSEFCRLANLGLKFP